MDQVSHGILFSNEFSATGVSLIIGRSGAGETSVGDLSGRDDRSIDSASAEGEISASVYSVSGPPHINIWFELWMKGLIWPTSQYVCISSLERATCFGIQVIDSSGTEGYGFHVISCRSEEVSSRHLHY